MFFIFFVQILIAAMLLLYILRQATKTDSYSSKENRQKLSQDIRESLSPQMCRTLFPKMAKNPAVVNIAQSDPHLPHTSCHVQIGWFIYDLGTPAKKIAESEYANKSVLQQPLPQETTLSITTLGGKKVQCHFHHQYEIAGTHSREHAAELYKMLGKPSPYDNLDLRDFAGYSGTAHRPIPEL